MHPIVVEMMTQYISLAVLTFLAGAMVMNFLFGYFYQPQRLICERVTLDFN